ncbi:CLUMA_CG005774, isoform A [Clunio marinus]|uniref:CLUMA_CG005774, isoform A n=1 Tax=Clunio marinus TaxID=568069 RepID=A0A1J1HXK9_9DIPT|nr:CLUMA_CG005774, isoform A [Clunio marinus]
MFLKLKYLIIFAVIINESLQQVPSSKCENEKSIKYNSYSTFYDRSRRYRCTFEHLKSFDDFKIEKSKLTFSTTGITSITFLNSSLSEFPEKIFNLFTNLKQIDASRLVLSEISATAFINLKLMDLIDLSNNNLKTLKARTFSEMQIKHLDLSMNLLETIDDTTFSNAHIEKINLSFNKLKSLKFANSFRYFYIMELNDNLIESFNEYEFRDEGVGTPKLSFYSTAETDQRIFLQNNKIKKFECSTNTIFNSVTLIGNSELNEISLNQCNIQNVDVSNCGTIEKISFSDNLSGFTAKSVKINNIEMSDTTSLKTLSLSNSSISPNLLEYFLKMDNLTFLDLSYINIGPLNISTFSKLKELQFLYLKGTNISNIQFGTFSHQHAVKILDISDNHLGYFDFNMIFSMTRLTSLDISGNDLSSVENFESAHFTFALLQTIDISNNKWACGYLLRLIKIFRIFKVVLVRSNLEENRTNIHGIGCVHVEGDDVVIEPLTPDNNNLTEFRQKINEVVDEVSKDSDFKLNIKTRMKQLEEKFYYDSRVEISTASLQSESSQSIKVQNSTLLEVALIIVCIWLIVFMTMKMFAFIKTNFLGRPRQMRAMSEHTLSMTTDDY